MTKASEVQYVVLTDLNGSPYTVTAGSGGTSMTDDAAFTTASSSVTPIGGIVTSDSVDSGDVGALAMLANRQLKVTLYDSGGVEASVGGGTQYDEDTASANAQKLTMAGVTRADTAASQVDTDGDRSTLIVDASGRLHVNVGNTVTVGSHAVTNAGTFVVQVDGTALTRLTDIETNTDSGAVVGNGAAATAQRVTLANDSTGIVALTTSTASIGKLAANSGVDIGDVDVTSISAGTNLIGDVGIQPRTTNGLTTFMASGSDGSSILVATAQAVKASAGKLYGYYIYNPEAAVTFVHFYNTAAASVTVGTTNPLFTLPIPAGSAANLISDIGITFSNAGWSVAATTTAGGNTAPSTGVSLVAWYA